jgi:7-carboxy-7-deazaguanine synthase
VNDEQAIRLSDHGQPARPSAGGRFRIAEIYASRQGEGRLTGTSSLFIRLAGCNLRCWFCDTPHASWQPDGTWFTLESLVEACSGWSVRHAVITGGEPLLFPELHRLNAQLQASGWHTTVETAGTIFQPVACDLLSISPKLADSRPRSGEQRWRDLHEQRRWQPRIVRQLIEQAVDYQLKYVVDRPGEIAEIEWQLDQLALDGWRRDDHRILLMPQGTTVEELDARSPWINAACQLRGWGFSDRAHIRWFGHARGT